MPREENHVREATVAEMLHRFRLAKATSRSERDKLRAMGKAPKKMWYKKDSNRPLPPHSIFTDTVGTKEFDFEQQNEVSDFTQTQMIPQRTGKLMSARYVGATIFVDHFSDYVYVHLMRELTAEATLEAKNAWERLAGTHVVRIRRYRADNGRYSDPSFLQDIKNNGQLITFCVVGAHHQNGIAERKIRDLTGNARTQLVHAMHLWPGVIKQILWPFALKAVVRAHKKFKLDSNHLSPEEKFSRLKVKQSAKEEHTLFCPVYCLDAKLQGGIGGLPKWDPRSRLGIFVGHSPDHASDVALVLNPRTGLVSPQYHVIFDDTFSTIAHLQSDNAPSNWHHLVENCCENYTDDPKDTRLIDEIAQALPTDSKFY